MQKFRLWAIGIVFAIVLFWLGMGTLIWSRNRVPALNFPAAEAMPAGNVYDDYAKCVSDIPAADKETFRVDNAKETVTEEQKAELVARNRDLLARFHKLVGKPCMVTHLEATAKGVATMDYPFLANLVGKEGEILAKSDPNQAAKAIVDGFAFVEDSVRGGADIHVNGAAPSTTPLCRSLSEILPTLPASACQSSAERLKAVIASEYPLSKIFANERFIIVNRMVKTVQPMGNKGFLFQFPMDEYDRAYLLRPKTEAIAALNTYIAEWGQQAEKPVSEMTPPKAPEEAKKAIGEGLFAADTYESLALSYRYKEARLRLAYTGMRIEEYHKTHGQYPASLAALGADPLLTDPFSGKPLIYQPAGKTFTLYSVGMNGEDDGNAPEGSYKEGMSRRMGVDIALKPQSAYTTGRRHR